MTAAGKWRIMFRLSHRCLLIVIVMFFSITFAWSSVILLFSRSMLRFSLAFCLVSFWPPCPVRSADLPSTWWSALCSFLRPHWRPRAPPQELRTDSKSATLSPHSRRPQKGSQATHAVTDRWLNYWHVPAPQVQYQCPHRCQLQHLNAPAGTQSPESRTVMTFKRGYWRPVISVW